MNLKTCYGGDLTVQEILNAISAGKTETKA